ncbi:MAG: discoidin domain-containing protein, partial [Clostridia bacterium]|nr:discoidin domain-containing protein [Clostridia bacterium]
NFTTRWNAFGEGHTLTLDLNEVKEIAAVAGSFYKGYERQYFFDIAVSEDGENWTVVLTDQASSGTTDEGVLEMFTFPETVKGRYIQYIGHGSSSNDANNIWELVPIAP